MLLVLGNIVKSDSDSLDSFREVTLHARLLHVMHTVSHGCLFSCGVCKADKTSVCISLTQSHMR